MTTGVKKVVKKLKKAVKKSSKLKRITNSVDISLPDEATEISDSMEDYTWLIYGERKIGKTTIFSEFDDAIFIMFDPLNKGLSIRQVYCPTWKHFLALLTKLEKKLKVDPDYCKMVVIDTGYMCYERCFGYKVQELGIIDPRDKAWGAGWKAIAQEFMLAHDRIFQMGIGLGVTAHSQISEVKRRGGESYDKLSVQLGGQALKFYIGLVDVIAYYQYTKDGAREMTIAGDSFIEAGSRVQEHFKYTNGEPIRNIPMGKTHMQAFKNLTKAFNNELKKEVAKKKVKSKAVKRK